MAERYGSDLMVDALCELGVEYLALNPGATLRGFHESLVASGRLPMILALHENVAVGIAHGYAKTTGRAMAVALHDLVGLQTGSMALFNAYLDMVPMLVLGGSGPADASRRRPWIDWIHAASDQGAFVRPFVKWDDQPSSLPATVHAIARGLDVANAFPCGPAYVTLDAGAQEDVLEDAAGGNPLWSPRTRLARRAASTVPDAELATVAEALVTARRPLLLADNSGRTAAGYAALIRLAETLGAPVVDLGGRHNFPNTHWADAAGPHWQRLAEADVVLSIDARDPYWSLARTDVAGRDFTWVPGPDATVFVLSGSALLERAPLHRSPALWDRAAALLPADSALALPRLAEIVAELVRGTDSAARDERIAALKAAAEPPSVRRARVARTDSGPISPTRLAVGTYDAVADGPWQLAFGALYGRVRATWDMPEWNCYLGVSGGGGLGYGVPASMGCALAHRDDDTLVVDLQPDGDFLYTASALWTAAAQSLPLLVVMANNRTYNQDRMHQSEIGAARGRGTDVAPGIDIDQPPVDFAALARAQGVEAFGPVQDAAELDTTLARAAAIVRTQRRPVLVDAVITRDRS